MHDADGKNSTPKNGSKKSRWVRRAACASRPVAASVGDGRGGEPACYVQGMFYFGRRVLVAVLAVGSFAAPNVAHAYCRTTTQQLPANYSPSRGCFIDGLFLYWRNACVSYSINQEASRTIPFQEAKRVIDNAFGTWMAGTCENGLPPGITVSNAGEAQCGEVRYNADGPNQNLIVFRDDGWPYQDPHSTLGLTTVTFNADTGEIYDADLEINSSGRNLSTSDRVPANGFDLASVITHEAGHFFGLAHATSTSATMYASYKPGTTALRTLAPDDVNGLCAIYPSSSVRIATPVPSQGQSSQVEALACDPSPRHGLTTACSEPKEAKSGCSAGPCSASPDRTTTWATASTLAVGLFGMFAARRRRR